VHVLYFADTRFPIERANGVQTMATCYALARAGHDVTLVVRPDSAPVARDPFGFYGVAPTPRLRITPIASAAASPATRVRFILGALRLATTHSASVVYTRDLGLAAFLLQLPRRRRPRVVYESHGIAPIVSAELPRLLGRPDLVPTATKLARLDRREQRTWSRAAAYVTITQALASDLRVRYGPRPDVFVAPDGAYAPESTSTYAPAAPPTVAYAGHLYPWKGVDVLVQAIARTPSLRVLIIGGHPGEADRARVERLARDLHVSDRVEITGLLPSAQVAGQLARATVLTLPNTPSMISERFTSPLKLFEYLWCGRPIVASNTAAIREVLTDRQSALLVAPGDPDALAGALLEVTSNHTLANALGAAARALAPEFTWARRAERLAPALEAAVA
jgi:glycosyltransferase involved in cell wall biosynthesis